MYDDALPMEIRILHQGEETHRRVYSNLILKDLMQDISAKHNILLNELALKMSDETTITRLDYQLYNKEDS